MNDIYPTALPFAEGDERRRHLATILERAAAIPPMPALATAGINGSQARHNDDVGRTTDTGNRSTIETPTDHATPNNRHSLRRAIVRSHRDLVRDRNDEHRRMVDVARTRAVDGRGDEVEVEASETQGEEQTQLARIVLPPSLSSPMTPPLMAADAPTSAQEASSSSSRNNDQDAEDHSKAQSSAAVAGTAILPLARKDIKRAQAA